VDDKKKEAGKYARSREAAFAHGGSLTEQKKKKENGINDEKGKIVHIP